MALSVAGVIEPTRAGGGDPSRVAAPDREHGQLRPLPARLALVVRASDARSCLQALDLLDRAIALDPDFGAALALAAVCHCPAVPLRLVRGPGRSPPPGRGTGRIGR